MSDETNTTGKMVLKMKILILKNKNETITVWM